MKTLAYEVVSRLKDTTNEQIINKGVLIAYFDDKNHFKFLEGLLHLWQGERQRMCS